jgi:hypothetical protein
MIGAMVSLNVTCSAPVKRAGGTSRRLRKQADSLSDIFLSRYIRNANHSALRRNDRVADVHHRVVTRATDFTP